MIFFISPFISKLVNMIVGKRVNRFQCNMAQAVHRARAWNGQPWDQEVKAQGHNGPKIALVFWWRCHSRLCWLSYNKRSK